MRYGVRWPRSASKRVKDLLMWPRPLGPDMKLTYTWDHGYERFDIEYDGGGASHFAGSYHPTEDSVCIGNPCDYCGHVDHDAASVSNSYSQEEGS